MNKFMTYLKRKETVRFIGTLLLGIIIGSLICGGWSDFMDGWNAAGESI